MRGCLQEHGWLRSHRPVSSSFIMNGGFSQPHRVPLVNLPSLHTPGPPESTPSPSATDAELHTNVWEEAMESQVKAEQPSPLPPVIECQQWCGRGQSSCARSRADLMKTPAVLLENHGLQYWHCPTYGPHRSSIPVSELTIDSPLQISNCPWPRPTSLGLPSPLHT